MLANVAAVTLNHTTITRPLCSPSVKTTLSPATVAENGSVHDTAVLLGSTGGTASTATGTVTYNVYSGNTCDLASRISAGAALPITTPGTLPDSASVAFPTAGTYYWQAVYSGDANNNPATSACTSEPLVVTSGSKANVTISTQLSSNGSIAVGASATDTATLTGVTNSVGSPTVIYAYYTDSACTLNAVAAGTVPVSADGVQSPSNSMPFNLAGTYYWQAVYSGDANNNGAISACNAAGEVLTVNKVSPSITTTLSPNTNTITVGGTASDGATLTGATSDAIGTVAYYYFTDSACSLNRQTAAIVSVSNGVVPSTDPITFNTSGNYYWQAVYTGDLNNVGTKSACGSEVLLVNSPVKTTPTLTTLLSSLFTQVGGTVHDTAVLNQAGGTAVPSGTVTYTVFKNNICSLGGQDAGTVTLTTNGTVPDSNPITFDTAGLYFWQAVYSGDANYNGATSPCISEALLVSNGRETPAPTAIPSPVPTGGSGGSSPTSTPSVLPGTGFAANRVTTLAQQSTAYANLGDLWLEIPRLGVQEPIVGVPQQANGDWDVSWLGNNSGWLNGTAFPTHAGNAVLTGHVYNADGNPGPFVHLNGLWWGDQVIVHAWGAKYVYEVRSVTQVTPGTTSSVIKHETLPWVTLITCRGYDEASNSYKYRVVVRAVLVDVK
jgi:LPXTG-site transpeptidase (sortase) family protein